MKYGSKEHLAAIILNEYSETPAQRSVRELMNKGMNLANFWAMQEYFTKVIGEIKYVEILNVFQEVDKGIWNPYN